MFRWPPDHRQVFVNRVIGVPGDRVRIAAKQVYLNGVAQDEPYTFHGTEYVDSYRDNFPSKPTMRLYPSTDEMLTHHVAGGEVVVPAGKYFVMGDNRDSSLDSRYWGFVDRDEIVGKPWLVYYSTTAQSDALVAISAIRWDRFFLRPR